MLSQSRQHNYVYWHNIRPCPCYFFLPLICDFSSFHSFFHFFYLFFCVSRRFTSTFFMLHFLSLNIIQFYIDFSHMNIFVKIKKYLNKNVNAFILICKLIKIPFENYITIRIESTSQWNVANWIFLFKKKKKMFEQTNSLQNYWKRLKFFPFFFLSILEFLLNKK